MFGIQYNFCAHVAEYSIVSENAGMVGQNSQTVWDPTGITYHSRCEYRIHVGTCHDIVFNPNPYVHMQRAGMAQLVRDHENALNHMGPLLRHTYDTYQGQGVLLQMAQADAQLFSEFKAFLEGRHCVHLLHFIDPLIVVNTKPGRTLVTTIVGIDFRVQFNISSIAFAAIYGDSVHSESGRNSGYYAQLLKGVIGGHDCSFPDIGSRHTNQKPLFDIDTICTYPNNLTIPPPVELDLDNEECDPYLLQLYEDLRALSHPTGSSSSSAN